MQTSNRALIAGVAALGLLVLVAIGIWSPGARNVDPEVAGQEAAAVPVQTAANGQPVAPQSTDAPPSAPAPPPPPPLDPVVVSTPPPAPAPPPVVRAFIQPIRYPVKITVHDEAGQPVRGADVRIGLGSHARLLTNGKGETGWQISRAGNTLFRAKYGKYVAARETYVPLGDTRIVYLTLSEGVTVKGLVVGADGSAIRGANVDVTLELSPMRTFALSTTTMGDGTFKLHDVPVARLGEDVALVVTAPGLAPAFVVHARDELLGGSVRIPLIEPLTVEGRVVDTAGQPVFGAEVGGSGSESSSVRSHPDGTFELDLTSTEDARLLVRCDGYVATRITVPTGRTGRVDLGDVVLRVGQAISGVVVTEDGTRVPNAWLRLRPERDQARRQALTRTDASGRFDFGHVDEGVWDVIAQGRFTVNGRRPLLQGEFFGLRSGDKAVRVVLRHKARVRLLFLDGESTRPLKVARATITASPTLASSPPVRTVSVGPQEAATVSLPGRETYDLLVEVPGYEPHRIRPVSLRPGQELELRVPLRAR